MVDSPPASLALSRPLKVMIVDDSAVIRSIIDRILRTDKNVTICGYAGTGEQAVNSLQMCDPDVVILDIEMPVMDGLTAIPLLLGKKPSLKILICSTLSERGADISLKALSLGATDYILKPSGTTSVQGSEDFHSTLLRLVRNIGNSLLTVKPAEGFQTRNGKAHTPNVLAIGSSTGGPNALAVLLKAINTLPVPIVITQHMPRTFTRVLAAHLSNVAGIPCAEGETGMALQPGRAYIAPGGFHMLVERKGHDAVIRLDDGPMENFCKPAVDPMLRSLATVYGKNILTVILTGMGEDGLLGARLIADQGGQIIAQDAASSIVWGMPGAVANAGLCSAVLPLNDMPGYINAIFNSSSFTKTHGGLS